MFPTYCSVNLKVSLRAWAFESEMTNKNTMSMGQKESRKRKSGFARMPCHPPVAARITGIPRNFNVLFNVQWPLSQVEITNIHGDASYPLSLIQGLMN